MAGIGEFIQNYLALAGFFEQQRNNRSARATAKADQLGRFIEIARNTTDPSALAGLVSTFEQAGTADASALRELLERSSPTRDVVQGAALNQGVKAVQGTPMEGILNRETAFQGLTGQGYGQTLTSDFLGRLIGGANPTQDQTNSWTEALLTRTATGMDPGAFAMSRTLAGLGGPTLTQGAEISLGTRMNAAQEAAHGLNVRQQGFSEWMGRQNVGLQHGQLSLGWANHRLANREFESNFALRQAEMAMEGIRANGASANNIQELLATQRNLLNDLRRSSAEMSPVEVQQYLQAIDNIGATLQGSGLGAVRIPNPQDWRQIYRKGWFRGFPEPQQPLGPGQQPQPHPDLFGPGVR